MILSFKPRFKEKILSGEKIHTIREDKTRRWQTGKKIHFATGVRTKNYNQFYEGECKFIQQIEIRPKTRQIFIGLNGTMNKLKADFHEVLAKQDGFDSVEDFWLWFDKPFFGVLIHWTDLVYS